MVSKVGIVLALAVAAVFVATANASPQPQQKITAVNLLTVDREKRDAVLDLNQIISSLISSVLNDLLLPVRSVLLNLLESVKSLLNQLVIPDSSNLIGVIINPILTNLIGTLTGIQTVINNGTPYPPSS